MTTQTTQESGSSIDRAEVPSAGRDVEQRVSVITGDRLCAACGFNLCGQTIVRESHYDMLMVRCPECAAVAALQEYPSLGRWAGRWAALLAAAWLLAVLGGLVVTGVVIAGMAIRTAEVGVRPLARHVVSLQSQWFAEQARQNPQAMPASYNYYAAYAQQPHSEYMPLDPAWWSTQTPATVLASAAGSGGVYDSSCLQGWFLDCIVLIAVGTAWSVVLMHVRRRRIWAVAFVLSLAGVAVLQFWDSPFNLMFWTMPWTTAIGAALEIAGAPLRWATVGASLAPLNVGLVLGRSMARLAARLLLGPRLRGALGLLWACDGLPMPSAR